jgi:DNA-binding LacI/PurR family transcriptional regulator
MKAPRMTYERRSVGIKDMASQLGISIGTVSRALNDRPDVNPETRRQVLEAARTMGYVANQSGRSLRSGTTNTIGLIIESGSETATNSDNFFLGLMDGLQSTLSRHQYDLVILPYSFEEDPFAYLRRIVARRLVDGLIITATKRVDPRIDLLTQARIPFAALGRSTTGGSHAWIDLDFEGVVRHGVERLIGKGHRRIAIGLPANDINLGYVCHDTYRAVLEQNGIAFDPGLVIRARPSEQGGYGVGSALIAMTELPTAILLVQDLMALGLYRRLTEHGLVPGRDIAVVGFREMPQTRFLSPHLTSFQLSLRDLGAALAEALLATMKNQGSANRQPAPGRIWPMELIEGESDSRLITR